MIKDLRENMTVDATFLVKKANVYTSQSGSKYLSMELQDASGTIEAKKFDLFNKDLDTFKAGNFVEVDADTNVYKEKLQLIVHSGSLLDPKKINVSHFVYTGGLNEDEIRTQTHDFIASIKDKDLHAIVKTIIEKYYDKFSTYPAAVTNHHDYYGGLATHTLSMCKVADAICKEAYKDVNRDLLISGCLLHDIGKVVELSGPIGTTYTTEGKLLGHLVIGAMLVEETARDLDIHSEEVLLLSHMLLAHHGKLEYGSPVLPMVKEGYILSMIDEMDAKVNAINKSIENIPEGTFSDRIYCLDERAIYKPNSNEEEE